MTQTLTHQNAASDSAMWLHHHQINSATHVCAVQLSSDLTGGSGGQQPQGSNHNPFNQSSYIQQKNSKPWGQKYINLFSAGSAVILGRVRGYREKRIILHCCWLTIDSGLPRHVYSCLTPAAAVQLEERCCRTPADLDSTATTPL